MTSKIILDASRYQQFIDFAYLKSMGQNKIFLKAGSGSNSKDSMFEPHYTEATENGFSVAPYFWVDPIYSQMRQAQYFLSLIQGKNIAFIVLDFEQWWLSWAKWSDWRAGKIPYSDVPKASPASLLAHFKGVYTYIKANSNYQILIYTAPWFLNSYANTAWSYLTDKFTWWADYSLFNTTVLTKTWEELENLAPVGRKIPTLPITYPKDKVIAWQWSGDKFKAKGVYGNTAQTRLSALDLNLWINDTYTWDVLSGISTPPAPPSEPISVAYKVVARTLRIRSYPALTADNSNIIGLLYYGDNVEINYIDENNWGKLADKEGWIFMDWVIKI